MPSYCSLSYNISFSAHVEGYSLVDVTPGIKDTHAFEVPSFCHSAEVVDSPVSVSCIISLRAYIRSVC